MNRIMLSDGWQLQAAGSSDSTPVTIPGTVLSGLLEAGKTEDPYFRENEYAARELLAKDYVFTTHFKVDELFFNSSHQELVCEGLDTLADVWLNGVLIGKADNMHRTWRFDCRSALQEQNELKIYFHSALSYIRGCRPTPGKEISYEPVGGILGNQYIRKAHSMFGWDWGAQLPDIGIWRDIYLESYDMRFDDIKIHQTHQWEESEPVGELSAAEYLRNREQTDRVILDVDADLLDAPDGAAVEAALELSAIYASGECIEDSPRAVASMKAEVANGHCTLSLGIENPKLWWPNGIGKQPLYKLRLILKDSLGVQVDSREYVIGLRELTVSTEKDAWGNEFALTVNGVKIFSMGADYIPEDCIYPWITRERIEYLISSSVRANYNTIRVWGGGYYPSDDFYDLCDRYGLIVWQDLMYACNVYDLTEEFEESIRRETIDNVRRLRHHASLGLWCGNNELESAWDHWGIAQSHSKALFADYIKQFEYVLPKTVRQEDEDTFYWPSSPSSGGCLDNPDDETRGDCHYWDVWHGMKPFSDYRKHSFRFCSEFGFQSFPERKTIDTFAADEDLNIFSPVMESHQKNGTANGKILTYISENFRYPKDFDSLLYVSQVLQGIAVKAGVDHWRENRGRCMGALYWQLNDNWPVASWASIDYFGRWKALHYMARRFFAMKAGSIAVEGVSAAFYAENESLENSGVTLTVRLRDMEFNIVYEETVHAEVKAQSSSLLLRRDLEQEIGARRREVYVEAEYIWDDESMSLECETFVPYKHLELQKPNVEVTVSQEADDISIQIASDCFTPFVWLELGDEDVIFDDNCFTITSDEPRVIKIKGAQTLSGKKLDADQVKKQLKVKSLRDTY